MNYTEMKLYEKILYIIFNHPYGIVLKDIFRELESRSENASKSYIRKLLNLFVIHH